MKTPTKTGRYQTPTAEFRFKCCPRDRWIGWKRELQFTRLHLIANNSRFLILGALGCQSSLWFGLDVYGRCHRQPHGRIRATFGEGPQPGQPAGWPGCGPSPNYQSTLSLLPFNVVAEHTASLQFQRTGAHRKTCLHGTAVIGRSKTATIGCETSTSERMPASGASCMPPTTVQSATASRSRSSSGEAPTLWNVMQQ